MIYYKQGCAHFCSRVVSCTGSVLPRAAALAIPNAIITMLFRLALFSDSGFFPFEPDDLVAMKNNGIWTSFNYLVGFLIVFRTSQGYSRFWEGVTHTQSMRSCWSAAASALCAFCRVSKADTKNISAFKHTLIRLISLMHAMALSDLEDYNGVDIETAKAFNVDVIDASGLDEESLKLLRDSKSRVELLYQWIQQLMVENLDSGVLAIPAPILSRSFQELGNGMVAFYQAMKISSIPFPFPYAQTCDFLLLLHWILVPIIVVQWTEGLFWSGLFSFLQVLLFQALNFIAVDIENPFGSDANDLDFSAMQSQMNSMLLMLLREGADRVPRLSNRALFTSKGPSSDEEELDLTMGSTLVAAWTEIGDGVRPRLTVSMAIRAQTVEDSPRKPKTRDTNTRLRRGQSRVSHSGLGEPGLGADEGTFSDMRQSGPECHSHEHLEERHAWDDVGASVSREAPSDETRELKRPSDHIKIREQSPSAQFQCHRGRSDEALTVLDCSGAAWLGTQAEPADAPKQATGSAVVREVTQL